MVSKGIFLFADGVSLVCKFTAHALRPTSRVFKPICPIASDDIINLHGLIVHIAVRGLGECSCIA